MATTWSPMTFVLHATHAHCPVQVVGMPEVPVPGVLVTVSNAMHSRLACLGSTPRI